MPTLIELMKDPSVVVRDTTAWTVGRICELLPEAAINDVYLAPLLQCLIEGLSAEPRVASNVFIPVNQITKQTNKQTKNPGRSFEAV